MKLTTVLSVLVMFTISPTQSLLAQWVQTKGPSGRGGPVYSVCIKDSTVFAGTLNSLYASKDNGTSWLNVGPSIPNPPYAPAVYSLAGNDAFMFAGIAGSGLYVSSDGGNSWSIVTLPGNPSITEMAAEGRWILAHGGTSGYQTTDNGATWTPLSAFSSITTVTVHDSMGFVGNTAGISISTDHGATWSIADSIPSGSGVTAFAASGSNVLAAVHNVIVSSSDSGFVWGSKQTPLKCNVINAIAFATTTQGREFVFAGTDSGLFRSSDSGATWTADNVGITSSLIYSLAGGVIGSGKVHTLFAGTGSGVFRSTDDGNTWVPSGIPSGRWYFAASDSVVFAGSSFTPYAGFSKYSSTYSDSHCEVYRSRDQGSTWTEADSVLVNVPHGILTSLSTCRNPSGGYDLFAGLTSNAIAGHCSLYRSTNDGSTWTASIPDTNIGTFPAVGSNYPALYLGTTLGGVFRSTDLGNSWGRLDSAMITPPYDAVSASVNAFSFDGSTIYAGGGWRAQVIVPPRTIKTGLFNYVLASTDGGAHWAKVDSGFSGHAYVSSTGDTGSVLTSLYASGSDMVLGLYAWNYGQVTNPAGGGIFHLTKNGANWTVADSARMGDQIASFAEFKSDLFAASIGRGVIHSTNFGKSWTDVSDGLGDVSVTSVLAANSRLFAATSSGVWRRPISEITSVRPDPGAGGIPARMSLAQNYPNPFNPTTSIQYRIPSNAFVTLRVYDLLGREVSLLVSERETAGGYTVTFDARGLASGVYFYRLTAGNVTQTRSMLVLK